MPSHIPGSNYRFSSECYKNSLSNKTLYKTLITYYVTPLLTVDRGYNYLWCSVETFVENMKQNKTTNLPTDLWAAVLRNVS